MDRFYHEVIEPNVECIPVLQVMHSERHNGREHCLTQPIARNVYTEFDRKLSRHLVAVRGHGFPAYTVTLEAADARNTARPTAWPPPSTSRCRTR